MANRWRMVAVLLLLLGIAVCGLLYLWFFRPPIEVVEMSIPKGYFPASVDYHPMLSNRDSLPALDSGNQTVYWSGINGLATFNVERLPTFGWASKAFRFYENLGSYPLYTDSLYRSSVADEFVTGCGTSEFGGFRCVSRARYREYVATLNVVIDDEMTIEEFEQIVKYVDQTFHNRLYDDAE